MLTCCTTVPQTRHYRFLLPRVLFFPDFSATPLHFIYCNVVGHQIMSFFSILTSLLIIAVASASSSSFGPILLPRGALSEIRAIIDTQHSPSSTSTQNVVDINTLSPRGGAISTTASQDTGSTANMKPIRVCFQGEAGAYSEKSLRELLGKNVIAVPRTNFESCYRAVASKECDYAIVPIENSLGGSIHENYDLMLRYDLTIVAEHDFRVRHCLLIKPGLDVKEIKFAISHPQALAQCDNYLRARNITPIPTYDTAGSASKCVFLRYILYVL